MEKPLERIGVPAPEAIGVDEISFRKYHTYWNRDKRFGEGLEASTCRKRIWMCFVSGLDKRR
ncbi:hypothetical protein B188_14400 [Candidatus Brocadiaceae bacterium B188]|nr:hypothetical protein [Candidatus Brocadia sapporoensis]QQR66505.1 MAG: hypothetical protein IPI25_13515 [Candidatus Brocadia sp.]RZV57046.1 MAG: hypothetical protein EX330_11220 [Candidatus Brocadia sp. BROELEC01]TWU53465.1 hypothetical protein B188_14400 [Candidatus Brocadiaceae bacterium B188]